MIDGDIYVRLDTLFPFLTIIFDASVFFLRYISLDVVIKFLILYTFLFLCLRQEYLIFTITWFLLTLETRLYDIFAIL